MLIERKTWLGLSFAGMMLAGIPAAYAQQQTTGTPGAPDATTTIDGNYIPPPPAPFGGTINLDATEFQTVLATDRGAAQRCAQRLADHDR